MMATNTTDADCFASTPRQNGSTNCRSNVTRQVADCTGIAFDERMKDHFCPWDPNYPENPLRFSSVINRITELGLVDRCVRIPSREASESEILRKHTRELFEILRATENETDLDKLEELSSRYDSIFINQASYRAALLSVGCSIDIVDAVYRRQIKNGLAIVRPGGHHSMENAFCGYCFFNDCALAAAHALENCNAQRILIFDWDVHHGQGIQQMFYDDPRVVYFSIHRHENGQFWPNLRESDYDYIGEGPGTGYNFNVPLNATGMQDADFLAILHHVFLPMAYEFDPDLVILYAGFDASVGDEKGEMLLTPAFYAHMLSTLMCLAGGRLAAIFGGGYCIRSLVESTILTLRGLLGEPAPSLLEFGAPCESIRESILNVIYTHRPYWRCFQMQPQYSISDPVTDISRHRHLPSIHYVSTPIPARYETRNCYPKQNEEFYRLSDQRIDYLIANTKLFTPPNRACCVFNSNDNNLIRNLDRCLHLEPRHVTQNLLSSLCATSQLDAHDLVTTLAAGTLLQVVDSVVSGRSRSGVAMFHQPTTPDFDTYCHFSTFNSLILAAQYAIRTLSLDRVLIVDWDIHHNESIQNTFLSDDRVLYISLHRYDNGTFPGSSNANHDQVGTGRGAGYNVNIPWNNSPYEITNGDYIAAFHTIVLPIAYQFNPQLVLISGGFDACSSYPGALSNISPELYSYMTHWLTPLANGRVILSLEGNYDVEVISHAMDLCVGALLGDQFQMLTGSKVPCIESIQSIQNVVTSHENYWTSLRFYASLPREDVLRNQQGHEQIPTNIVQSTPQVPVPSN